MYLFCTTRHGVSGKELQRQLGVTYKTGWRIGMQIRKLTENTENFDALLPGHVEIDEAYRVPLASPEAIDPPHSL